MLTTLLSVLVIALSGYVLILLNDRRVYRRTEEQIWHTARFEQARAAHQTAKAQAALLKISINTLERRAGNDKILNALKDSLQAHHNEILSQWSFVEYGDAAYGDFSGALSSERRNNVPEGVPVFNRKAS